MSEEKEEVKPVAEPVIEPPHPTVIVPATETGDIMVARLICIRAPMQNEGGFTMAELELHTKTGVRGKISIPYLQSLGKLGSCWMVDLVLREAEQRDYLRNRADTLDLVREDTNTPIVGVV